MKNNWAGEYLAGRISRRDFVDFAAVAGVGAAATGRVLRAQKIQQAAQKAAQDFDVKKQQLRIS